MAINRRLEVAAGAHATGESLSPLAEIHRMSLDDDFAEWVRAGVRQFAETYDSWDPFIYREVLRQHRDVYDDYVDAGFDPEYPPVLADINKKDAEAEKELKQIRSFQRAARWSEDGTQCLSCGRAWNGRWIDLATLSSAARRTLVALHLMSEGDSALLVAEPPYWKQWESSEDPIERNIAGLVSDYADPNDGRFERIGIVAFAVLSEWGKKPSPGREHNPADTVSPSDKSQETGSTVKPARGSVWRNALNEAEKIRLRGEPWTSYRQMAEKIGCSHSVLCDAIKQHGAVELQEWTSTHRGESRLNVSPESAALAIAGTPQARETDPASVLYECDVDAVMAKLISQSSPSEAARLQQLNPAEQRRLAETVYRDPDSEEQDRRHRRAKRKRSRSS